MIDWQRHRAPEDVPTPIAVALSDFCRRAKAPAAAAVVREALSLLPEADDFRVRALTDDEPPATPLGPFAVIDVVRGTEPTVAAQREQTGYYEMVRAMAQERARTELPPVTSPVPQRVVASSPAEARRPARAARSKKNQGPSLAEKIAPRRRAAGEARSPDVPPPAKVPATAFLPRRQLPAPRGRFSRVDPSRTSVHALLKPDAYDTLSALVDQVPHRVALLRTLAQGYIGRAGAELSAADVASLLDKHRLRKRLETKERDVLLGAVLEQRGALGRSAHALGLRPKELEGLLKELRVTREVKEIQERSIKEALSPRNLGARLELLARTRYLADLGIEGVFRERLEAELRRLLDDARAEVNSTPALVELVARRHALDAEALRRALDALGLLDPLPPPAAKP